MSKYQVTSVGEDGGFKNQRDEDEHVGSLAFTAACANAGVSPVPTARPGGTKAEMHENRKALRSAVNTIHESIGMRAPTETQLQALTWAGVKVSRMTALLEDAPASSGPSGVSAGDWRDSNGRPLKQLRTMDDFKAHYRTDLPVDEQMTLVDFFRGVANMPTTPGVRNALSEGTNAAGGFTLPSVVMPQILGALVPNSSLLQAGMPIIPLNDGAKSYTTAILSGVPTAAWRSEGGAVAESDPVFSGVAAAPQSLSFFFKISRELFADSMNLSPALLAAIGQAMAKELDRAGLRGTGTPPQPRGILNTSGIQTVTNGANGTALGSYANLFSAVQALLQADAQMPNAAIMSPRSLIKLGGLLDTTNQPLRVPTMLEPVKLLGTSQIPNNLTVGTSTDCSEIYTGDFTKMALMLRESLSVQLLSERYADTGQLAFMCHCRADFAVMYPSAFALVTGVRP